MNKKCVLCGKKYEGYGNNAQPLKKGQCCDDCNIIARSLFLNIIKQIEEE